MFNEIPVNCESSIKFLISLQTVQICVKSNYPYFQQENQGAQWFSGRVLDSIKRVVGLSLTGVTARCT